MIYLLYPSPWFMSSEQYTKHETFVTAPLYDLFFYFGSMMLVIF